MLVSCLDGLTVKNMVRSHIKMDLVNEWMTRFNGVSYLISASLIITVLVYLVLGIYVLCLRNREFSFIKNRE